MSDIIIKLERAYKGRSLTPAKKGVCAGCGFPTKRGNKWCSSECYHKLHPINVKKQIFKLQNGKCKYCDLDGTEYHHKIAHADGGHFTVENIILLCHNCHVKETRKQRILKSFYGKNIK